MKKLLKEQMARPGFIKPRVARYVDQDCIVGPEKVDKNRNLGAPSGAPVCIFRTGGGKRAAFFAAVGEEKTINIRCYL